MIIQSSFHNVWTFMLMYAYVCWSLSHVQLFTTPWTVAYQDPASIEFSRQEY